MTASSGQACILYESLLFLSEHIMVHPGACSHVILSFSSWLGVLETGNYEEKHQCPVDITVYTVGSRIIGSPDWQCTKNSLKNNNRITERNSKC